MKKIIVPFFSVVVAFSFSSIAIAAADVTQCDAVSSKQLIQSGEEPILIPVPEPVPEPTPVPTPTPDPVPMPTPIPAPDPPPFPTSELK